MKENFPKGMALTLKYEGGYVDDPYDPGGATNAGVTQATYNVFCRHRGRGARPVKLMTPDERDEIYRAQYWDEVDCDALASGVDVLAFDIAVNSGPGRARAFLCGAPNEPIACVHYLDSRRRSFWRGIMTFWRFGRGWMARENDLLEHALLLAQR